MRGLTRRWLLRDSVMEDRQGVDVNSPSHRSLLQRVLHARGMTDATDIERFCEPRLNDLHDPSLLPGVDDAAERLVHALRNDHRIVIYGDYDVDGITATAILYHVLKCAKPSADVRSYVPHRIEEGYGINCEALKQIRADGADLVISVDCGITARDSAKTAHDIGLDLIITDHHHLPADGELPDADVLVHPRLPGSRYPFGDLCGAGVAFKLCWRFATVWCGSERVSEVMQRTLLDVLPLVALGTIADVVPLIDENRVLARFGLRLIKQTPLVGLKALIEASNLMDEKIDCEKVGFVLGPRLNACGRLGHAGEAVRMLTDASPEEAARTARGLTRINQQRQRTERAIFEQARQMAEDAGMTREDRRAIVLADPTWHPGVVGIVCSRLVDAFGRPTILLNRNGELCKGSARSIDGYSIHEGLCACASHLSTYGGHDMAAGLALAVDRLEAFTEDLIDHANTSISPEELVPAIRIDCDAWLDELDRPTVEGLQSFSPFGRANRKPVVRVPEVVVAEPPRQIGSHGKHLLMRIRQERDGRQRVLRSVWWKAGHLADNLASGMRLDVAIEPKINAWNGNVSVEAEVRDVRVCERERERDERSKVLV